MKDFSGRGSLGEVQWSRILCQGVPYLVLRATAQEFSLLVRAGQGVTAAVAPHVECSIHGVGEVGGLVRVQGKVSIQQATDIIRFSSFVHLVCRVPNLHVHGSVRHPLVLEALSPSDSPLIPEYHSSYQKQQ